MNTLVRYSLLALAAAGTLPAQFATPVVHATVPFEFTVMGRTMPAGGYVIDRSNSNTVILKCREHNASVIVSTDALETAIPHELGKLVFHRYGNQYFLSEVWSAGSYGRKLHQTKVERDLALRTSPARTVVTAAR